MFADLNVYSIAPLVVAGSAFLSGLVVWSYLRKVTSSQATQLTRWQKYGQPALILAVTNFITATAFVVMLIFGNEEIYPDDWPFVLIGYTGCYGCFFGLFMVIYVYNIFISKSPYSPWRKR